MDDRERRRRRNMGCVSVSVELCMRVLTRGCVLYYHARMYLYFCIHVRVLHAGTGAKQVQLQDARWLMGTPYLAPEYTPASGADLKAGKRAWEAYTIANQSSKLNRPRKKNTFNADITMPLPSPTRKKKECLQRHQRPTLQNLQPAHLNY